MTKEIVIHHLYSKSNAFMLLRFSIKIFFYMYILL